jgi:hypothetical protein
MNATVPYKGGSRGIDVQRVFEGITDLLPIYEELADGSEIMWAEHAPKKLRSIRKRVKDKREFFRLYGLDAQVPGQTGSPQG